jgi:restriction system protein
MSRGEGPEFVRFFRPTIEALKEKGGSGTSSEITDRAIELLGLSEAEQNVELPSGGSRVRNQAQWARHYLFRGGLVESSSRAVWQLTEIGAQVDPTTYDFLGLMRRVLKEFHEGKKSKKKRGKSSKPVDATEVEGLPDLEEASEQVETSGPEETSTNYHNKILSILRSIPPEGFERLCQRLLRESGFEKVVVTGKSGDGGIDGMGILQLNAFVSFNVLFQCKRYSGSVTPSQIRDFRGAMQGRADKGIILTTGTFTVEAKKEARRDGAPPIELVDGDDLVKLFENLQFGLRPRMTYDVDDKFFDDFREDKRTRGRV